MESSLVIDDTVLQKYGKKIEGASYFWDNSEEHVVWGHCIVNSICVEDNGAIHPYKHQIYLKQEDAIKFDRGFKIKIQIAMELVINAKKGFEIKSVIVDSWYLSNEFAGWVRQQRLYYFSELKMKQKELEQTQKIFRQAFREKEIHKGLYFINPHRAKEELERMI